MDRTSVKIAFSSDSRQSAALVIYVEPWGEDYTLLPGEGLEVVVYGEANIPWFHIVGAERALQLYCEDTVDFIVLQNGQPIACGHNRQVDSSA